MDASKLENQTLEQLRALARAAGLRGYSDLRKKQLIELLLDHKARSSAMGTSNASVQENTAKSKPASAATSAAKFPSPASVKSPIPPVESSLSTEQRIESAKFEMAPPGIATNAARAATSILHEDIDNLPMSHEPMLCLLPQKPGVVHAYWVLPSGASAQALKLRLCAIGKEAIEILDEVAIAGERGHWYFQVPERAVTANLLAHLGYYDARGNFVTAIDRGIARVPSLYASNRTDRSWWVSDDDFRAMYLRAGGVVRGQRLAWGEAASSSPAHAPSSRQK